MEVLIVILVVAFFIFRAYLTSPTRTGARGERRVRRRLIRKLPGNEYDVYTDITLPSAMGETQIDHIVLSRYGVFVVETKNYSGWIFGDAKSKQWTQTLYRRKYRFQNPLRQNFKHVKAVQAFFQIMQSQIHSVVVFAGKSTFKTDMPANVTDLKGLYPFIRSHKVVMFEPAELDDMAIKLNVVRAGMTPERHDEAAIRMEPDCPRCGNPMVRRRARKGKSAGQEFWGCSKYPYCRGTRKIASVDD